MVFLESWVFIKEIAIEFIKYGFPTIAIGISILSFLNSRKASKIQDRLYQVEEKLKNYELEEIEKKREEASKAIIEARIYKVSNGNYRLKLWNSGGATAHNVNFFVHPDYGDPIIKQKVPYEFLESNKSFEEHVVVVIGTPNKLKITTTWKNKEGTSYSKEQLLDVY